MENKIKKKIILFDVDGTLAESGCKMSHDMVNILKILGQDGYDLGVVGGGLYDKILWQLDNSVNLFKYIFAESGGITYIDGNLIKIKNMSKYIDNFDDFCVNIRNIVINFMKNNGIPLYEYDVIDIRKGLIYISLAGIGANKEERKLFINMDKEKEFRYELLNILSKELPAKMTVKLGGNTGMGVYIKGWDKSQVLEYIKPDIYSDILFYGDRTSPNGNDYPLYSHPRVTGFAVNNDIDTLNYLKEYVK